MTIPDQPLAYDERMSALGTQRRKRKFVSIDGENRGLEVTALAEAAGMSAAELRMPGAAQRDSRHEGPQVRLRLCTWIEKTYEALGGTDEVYDLIIGDVAEKWGVPRFEAAHIVRHTAKWETQCEARGSSATGLRNDEAQLPQ